MTDTESDGQTFPPTDALVGVIMGSKNDWPTMSPACEVLERLGIAHEKTVVSAHRTPGRMFAYAQSAADRGLQVIIAGAGGAAHLPGMVASETHLPVIGVPVQSRALNGLDSLLSIVQMPGGIPVATMAIGTSGAKNAGLLAARILALSDAKIRRSVQELIAEQTRQVLEATELE
ncbi:5-(carboxyamino)imidazole ribonucleotide mutase [Roseiconus nitratireducens]|uniref:N5-carboxyaminoimidazole ribonucleotide mutase n=1 Tax=Roseiconus nitratireducens TaxID=2605748 RepID=A0A5M6CZH8_9BACT|nr:5-(carboxyamino)imidazole ribonucleotide mutase [Roseiconus nitratireducens]KAA5540631.1 5-(carboxyamino)imidazole ribonucleotide mutase [Roseiconus nitratireducens]